MAVRKIKKSWWVDFSFNGTRYRMRSPANSKAGASSYEALVRQRLALGEEAKVKPKARSPLFKDFAQRWFEEYVVANNKPRTREDKRYTLRGTLIPFFGHLHLDQISSREIERFKTEKAKTGLSPKTINNRLLTLNTILRHAYEWELLQTPHSKIKFLKTAQSRTDYLSEMESNALLLAASGTIYELILTALRTGMRRGELKALQWSSLDWDAKLIVVRHTLWDGDKTLDSTKSNRERYIPMDAELHAFLSVRRRHQGFVFTDQMGQPFNSYGLTEGLEEVCKRAGIRRITWHVLRHTFATQLAMKGVPLNVVQTLLGHSTILMTMRYAHVAPSSLHSAIGLLGGSNSVAANDNGQLAVNQPFRSPWREAA
jgi:integrase